MFKRISFIALFTGFSYLGFGQITKTDAEFELAKYTKNTCYRFSISHMSTIKEIDVMVEDNFEIKFGETMLTILSGNSYFAIPYNSVSMIQSSSKASKKEGKFSIYIH